MEFADANDDIRVIDSTAKNKWKWEWVQNTALESSIKKTKGDGQAWCCICKQTLKYGSSGKKALLRHVDSPQHSHGGKTIKQNNSTSALNKVGTVKMGSTSYTTCSSFSQALNKVGTVKMGSTSYTTPVERLHENIRRACRELESFGYDSLVVVTSSADHMKTGSKKGRHFLEACPDFIEEFCRYCREDETSSDKEEPEETAGQKSELPSETVSLERKKDISKSPTTEGSPGFDSESQEAVRTESIESLDKAESELEKKLDKLEEQDAADDDELEDSNDDDIDDDDDDGDSIISDLGSNYKEMEASSEDDRSPVGRKVVITFKDPDEEDSVIGSSVSPASSVSFIEMALKTSSALPEHLLPPIEKPHACTQCDKRYTRREDLVIHERTHTGELPFPCETCGRAFRSRALLRHHSAIHTGLENRHITCDVCGARFSRQSYLRRHKIIHSDDLPYRCATCSMGFKDPSSYKRHVQRHEGTKKHFCDSCGKGFLGAYELKCHKLTHTNVKPFSCEICDDRRFRTKKALTIHHRKVHLKLEQPNQQETGVSYICDLCGMEVSGPASLKRHKLRHDGVKSHYCGTCGKGFLGSYDLKCHLKIHSGEKSHRCEICGLSFRLGTYLNKHKRIVHGLGKPIICK